MKRLLILAALGLCIIAPHELAWALIPGSVCGPPFSETQPPMPVQPPSFIQPSDTTIGTLLNNADTTEVTLTDKVVTASFPDFFYIQEDDRSAGIRVQCSASVSPGNRVTVTGTLASTTDGERYLSADAQNCTVVPTTFVPSPLAMDSLTVGGTKLNDYTYGIDYADECEWLELTNGCYNLGLLIRTWGRVESVDTGWFELDDGTVLYRPIRVDTSNVSISVNTGDYVVVMGISSCFQWSSGGNIYKRPLVRIRDSGDVVPVQSGSTLSASEIIVEPSSGYGCSWNLISLPGTPFIGGGSSASPPSVFGSWAGTCGLWKWRTTGPQHFNDSYYVYNPESQESWRFGAIYSGQGYWIRNAGSSPGGISYQALPGSVETADRFIRLPYGIDANGCGGFTLIGQPFQSDQSFGNLCVTDGCHVLSMADAIANNWVDSTAWWWDGSTNTLKTVALSGGDDTSLRPWHGYWIRSFRDKLALIIPCFSNPVPATPEISDDGAFTNSDTSLHAIWTCSSCDESVNHWYAIGTISGGTETTNGWIAVGFAHEVTKTGLDLDEGPTYYVSVKAVSRGVFESAIDTSDGIRVDVTPPTAGTAQSPAYATESPITVDYDGASDMLSELDHVELWYKKGLSGVWTNSGQSSASGSGQFDFSPVSGPGTYYFDLVAEDNAGNRSPTPSGEGDCSTVYTEGLDPCSFSAILIVPSP